MARWLEINDKVQIKVRNKELEGFVVDIKKVFNRLEPDPKEKLIALYDIELADGSIEYRHRWSIKLLARGRLKTFHDWLTV